MTAMQNDLISRSALIAHIGDLGNDPEDDTTFLTVGQACAITHKCIVYIVKAEPAVDAVPVVRCKDCRRCDGFPRKEIEPNEIGICRINRMAVKPDDFCSYGERRADDGK